MTPLDTSEIRKRADAAVRKHGGTDADMAVLRLCDALDFQTHATASWRKEAEDFEAERDHADTACAMLRAELDAARAALRDLTHKDELLCQQNGHLLMVLHELNVLVQEAMHEREDFRDNTLGRVRAQSPRR